jgi:hypothetical protein
MPIRFLNSDKGNRLRDALRERQAQLARLSRSTNDEEAALGAAKGGAMQPDKGIRTPAYYKKRSGY